MNTIHPSIQFTSDYSFKTINFLNVAVTVESSGDITTDLYTKPTDTHQYLLNTSCHPNHTKRSIPYSQALSIFRICSNLTTANMRCEELTKFLVNRGHGLKAVTEQINRARTKFQNPVPKPILDSLHNVFFTVTFHPGLPDIKSILCNYFALLHKSPKMRLAVPNVPILSFKQSASLGKMLCRAKVQNTSDSGPVNPSQPCNKNKTKKCQLCKMIVSDDKIWSTATGKTFHCKNSNTNCNSDWLIYVISCPTCDLQYVGQTNNIRLRMNNHKSDLRKYKNDNLDRMENPQLYQHLALHSQDDQFKFQIVDKLITTNKDIRYLDGRLDRKEKEWIWKLKTITPHGLNIDDGFHSQTKKMRKQRVK